MLLCEGVPMWATVLARGTSWRTLEDACTLESRTCENAWNSAQCKKMGSHQAQLRPGLRLDSLPLRTYPYPPQEDHGSPPKANHQGQSPLPPLLTLGSLLVTIRGRLLARALSLSLFHLQSARTRADCSSFTLPSPNPLLLFRVRICRRLNDSSPIRHQASAPSLTRTTSGTLT